MYNILRPLGLWNRSKDTSRGPLSGLWEKLESRGIGGFTCYTRFSRMGRRINQWLLESRPGSGFACSTCLGNVRAGPWRFCFPLQMSAKALNQKLTLSCLILSPYRLTVSVSFTSTSARVHALLALLSFPGLYNLPDGLWASCLLSSTHAVHFAPGARLVTFYYFFYENLLP